MEFVILAYIAVAVITAVDVWDAEGPLKGKLFVVGLWPAAIGLALWILTVELWKEVWTKRGG